MTSAVANPPGSEEQDKSIKPYVLTNETLSVSGCVVVGVLSVLSIRVEHVHCFLHVILSIRRTNTGPQRMTHPRWATGVATHRVKAGAHKEASVDLVAVGLLAPLVGSTFLRCFPQKAQKHLYALV